MTQDDKPVPPDTVSEEEFKRRLASMPAEDIPDHLIELALHLQELLRQRENPH